MARRRGVGWRGSSWTTVRRVWGLHRVWRAAPGVLAGAEADVAVIRAGGALISQQEGDEARRILGEYRLGRVGHNAAGVNVARWVKTGRPLRQGWQRGELEGVFPSWVALSALPTSSGKADPGPLAVARQALGRTVVGALWRSVEAARGGAGGAGGCGCGWRVGGWSRGWRGGWRLRWPGRFLRPTVSRGSSWRRVFR